MHGLGNDFVVFDMRPHAPALGADLARRIADRRLGIGCDQIVLIGQARDPKACAFVRFLNADGSEAEACGNGTRCAAKLLFAEGRDTSLAIETLGGVLTVSRERDLFSVDMGTPRLDWSEIPLSKACDTLHVTVADAETGFEGDAVCTGMGNPHATFFVPDLEAVEIARVGPALETHELFPRRANIGFARILDVGTLRLRVWERGSGLTLACGSAACAAAVAAARRGLTRRKVEVGLELGSLFIDWREDGRVIMTGPAAISFAGTLDPSWLASA